MQMPDHAFRAHRPPSKGAEWSEPESAGCSNGAFKNPIHFIDENLQKSQVSSTINAAVVLDSNLSKVDKKNKIIILDKNIEIKINILKEFLKKRHNIDLLVTYFSANLQPGKPTSGMVPSEIIGNETSTYKVNLLEADKLVRNLESINDLVILYFNNSNRFQAAYDGVLGSNTYGITQAYAGSTRKVIYTYGDHWTPKSVLAHEFMHTPGRQPQTNIWNMLFTGHNWSFNDELLRYGIDPTK